MTDKEAMKLALEALETLMLERGSIYEQAITALKERLADPMRAVQRLGQEIEQEPVAHQKWCASLTQLLLSMPPQPAPCNCHPPQRTEQNFCSRCGKRTPDLITIHTCTPPQENT